MMKNIYKDILFGVAIGDALGVPVEFKTRAAIAANPVVDMRGFGTHHMPAGTFSDDSSLTFCLAENLTDELTVEKIAENLVKWCYDGFWTPFGNVFDIGIATQQAISKLKNGVPPTEAGNKEEASNGNGSLMRILPLVALLKDWPIEERFFVAKQVSAITHAHIRSVIACFYYLEFARQIILGNNKFVAYKNTQTSVLDFLNGIGTDKGEIAIFERLLLGNMATISENEIQSSGYVLHTLEASIWCILTTHNYKTAVLKAVNLGNDTDTTGAVTGGLAALLYGFETIPLTWMQQLAKRNEIDNLAQRWQTFANSQKKKVLFI